MRSSFLVLLATLAFASMSLACGGGAKAKQASNDCLQYSSENCVVLNNVVSMDAEGNRSALCACGMKVTVDDHTPKMQLGNATMYMCSEGCMAHFEKASADERQTMTTQWRDQVSRYAAVSNVYNVGGKQVYSCCGKEQEVGSKTASVTENGVTIYTCGPGCASNIRGMSATDRIKTQKKIIQGS